MESFGKTSSSSGRCREILVCSVVMVLCGLLQQAQGLAVNPRVARLSSETNGDVDLSSGHYYVFLGDSIKIYCYCSDDNHTAVLEMDLRLNNVEVASAEINGCFGFTHTLENVGPSAEGPYQCVAELTNGTIHRTPAGHLHIVDPRIIQVPHIQYGLLHSNTTLNWTVDYEDSTSITWRGPTSKIMGGRIVGVALEHEGSYICEVYLSAIDLLMRKPVQFKVIVPPAITGHPPSTIFTRNERRNLTVYFRSKMSNETYISWYKDGNSLQADMRSTTQLDSISSKTEMTFNPIRRSDGGEYNVVIENTHGIIPDNQRRTEVHFTVTVSILPARPTGLAVQRISDTTASLSWSIAPSSADQAADSQIITMHYDNGSLAYSTEVGGGVTEFDLSLIPGKRYTTRVQTQNQDGSAVSEPFPFQALAGAPLLSEVQVRRGDSTNTFNLKAFLAYTGGGSIAYFAVSFQLPEASEWTTLGNFTASAADGSQLIWTAQVVDDRLQFSRIEMLVTVINSNGYASNSENQLEMIVLPEAPTRVDFVSSDFDSVLLSVALPVVGTAPLTRLGVEFIGADTDEVNITVPGLNLGGVVQFTLPDLQDGTVYVISLAVYNYGGKGTSSQPMEVSTATRPPLPIYAVVLVAVGGILTLAAVVITIMALAKKRSSIKQRSRAYSVAEAESNKFPSDTLVKHGKNSPLSPCSSSPPTPSTATSILTTPHPSPPGFPSYCSASTPYLPSSSTAATDPATSHNPATFKFDAGSSRSNSVNQDSDFSESNFPRYTYTLPQSGEVTPQIPRAYDQVDLPLPHLPRAYDQVDLPIDHVLAPLNGRLGAHHVSYDPIRFNKSRVPSRMCSTSTVDSPHLRTQSSHSVATMQTRLTSNESLSTRDSLPYPRIENNNTDV